MKAIVYTSNTGFTARYAQMLGEKLALPVLELKDACKQLPKGTEIIYMGWLFASAVKGYPKANDRFRVSAVIGVGLCQTGTLIEDVMKTNDIAEGVPVFTLQGGMDHSKLKGINKFMINMLIKMMSKAKNPSLEDRAKLELIRTGGDLVREENLDAVLRWYNEVTQWAED